MAIILINNQGGKLKMKKLLALLLICSLILVGCGDSGSDFEVALVTDAGDINDKSFNQSAWQAIEKFGKEKEVTYKYYKPNSFDDAGYKAQIEEAVHNGAKVIVCPGYKFCNAIGELQEQYDDVKFILIDATPTVPDEKDSTKSKTVEPKENVYCALYNEVQPGYLAGYAAVKGGYKKLGFMGGIALPAVINYGYGYIQGANDAAAELGINVELIYNYTGTFSEDPAVKTKAAKWYNAGTEVIFSCGGGICNSIFPAAKEAGKFAIGVDSNQNDDSTGVVITSALKDVYKTVYDKLTDYKNDKFKGGIETLDATGGYVGLPKEFERLGSFNEEAYNDIFTKVANGTIKIKSMSDIDNENSGDPTKLKVTNVNISYDK